MSELAHYYCWPEESPSSGKGEKYWKMGAVCYHVFKSFPMGKGLSYFLFRIESHISECSVDKI